MTGAQSSSSDTTPADTTTSAGVSASTQEAAPPTATAPTASNAAGSATPAVSGAPSSPSAPTTAGANAASSDGITLSTAQFRERLERSNAKFLRDNFGTDNVQELVSQFEEAKKLRAAEDQRRREQMTETQRLNEDLARERARATAAEQSVKALREGQEVERERRRVAGLASKYIDAAYTDVALIKWAKEVQALPKKQLARMTDGDLEKWFRDYAKAHPQLAKARAQAPTTRTAPTGPTNGPGPGGGQRPAASRPVSPTAKTAKPNQPNSMSKAEIRKAYGVTW